MKKISMFFATAAAFVAMPAWACQFGGEAGAVKVGGLMAGDASAQGQASMGGVLGKFWTTVVAQEEIGQKVVNVTAGQMAQRAGCTREQFETEFVRLNGGDPAKNFSYTEVIAYPKVRIAPAAPTLPPPLPSAPASPAAEASAAASPAATPSTPARPAAEAPVRTTIIQKVELSPAEKAEMAALSDSRKQIELKIDAINAKPAPTEADLTALAALEKAKTDIDLKLTDFQKKLTAISGRVNNQAIEMADLRNWIYGLVIGLVLLALGVILLWWKKPSRKALAKTNHNVAELSKQVTANEEKIESVGQQSGAVDIRFGVGQIEDLNALPEGETLPVEIIIDGEKKFEIRFKRVENGLFVADEPKSRFRNHDPQVTIANPYKFVCRNYGKGEFTGFLLTPVAAAA